MLEQIFLKVLNMGITAGYCMMIVLVLRIFLRKQPKIYSYVLWAAVFFRLACPVSLQSTLSILRVKTNPVPQEIRIPEVTQIANEAVPEGVMANGNGIWNEPVQDPSPTAAAAVSGSLVQEILAAAVVLWIVGFSLLLLYSTWSYIRLRLQLRDAVLVEEGVYEKEEITTPFVAGWRRPEIFLPPDMEEQNRRFVLEHEKTHIRRRDYLVKQAAFLVCCVHWFQPAAWISFYLMCRDMEMSCDEYVIQKFGSDIRKPYSAALLSLSSGRKIILGSPLAFGESGIRSRIVNVLRYKKRSVWTGIVMIILIAAVMTGLVLNPKEHATEAGGQDGKDNDLRTPDTVDPDIKNSKTPVPLENIRIAYGEVTLSDGTGAVIELWMRKGTYYNNTMEEYVPSIYTYEQNFEGSYVLRTIDENGNLLYETALADLWQYRGPDFNFPEEFLLQAEDYNADGCPDLTIGLPQSSSNTGYLLFTVREDGTIEKLCREEIPDTGGTLQGNQFSAVLKHDKKSENKTITGFQYNNAIGETQEVSYDYNAQEKLYELADAKDSSQTGVNDGQVDPSSANGSSRQADVAHGQGEESGLADNQEQETEGMMDRFVLYEGYMDEFPNDSRQMYRRLDLDQDGLKDRIYRKITGETASFEVQFGNKERLFLGEMPVCYVTPSITSAQITNSENRMLLFEVQDIFGEAESRIALFTQFGGEYHTYERSGDAAGPYLDPEKMRAGYPCYGSYDADTNSKKITFQDTNRSLEWIPENKNADTGKADAEKTDTEKTDTEKIEEKETDGGAGWKSDTAFLARFLSYQGEVCVAFYQDAGSEERQKLFCYLMAVRDAPLRSDWTPYDMELVYLGWADDSMEENGITLLR